MICFEKANIKDTEQLVAVKIRAFRKEILLYGFGPDGYDSIDKEKKLIKNGIYYKILDDSKIIGGLIISDKANGHFRLNGLYIDLDYQNKGVGTKAMKFIEREFPKAKKWSLDTPYLSYRNHHFYEKMGFKKIGETTPLESGFYLYEYEKENL